MSATLYRSGDNWVIKALHWHVFSDAKSARLWARENRLILRRAKSEDN